MQLTYGSVCSGIESASVAWEPLGMAPLWFAEIEKFPSKVLAHHWPHVPNLGDMTLIARLIRCGMVPAPDVLVGGTPCQAFSVAGLRESLDDARGQLTLEYVRVLDAIDEQRKGDECVAVWENVPGVLNTKDNAFGCFLGALSGAGCQLQPTTEPKPQPGRSTKFWAWCRKTLEHYPRWSSAGCVFGPQRAVAWRVLDAQYFGVAQRRRRVFVVASARNGFDPGQVLFEFDGVRRDSPPGREAAEEVAGTLASRTGAGGFPGSDEACSGYIQAVGYRMAAFGEYADDETASTMKARDYKDATDLAVACTDIVPTTVSGGSTESSHNQLSGQLREQYVTPTKALRVRRLIPTECERLQGFPDGHTAVPGAADGPRYKAIGNSKAVPGVRWLGKRLLDHLAALRNTTSN